jgi:hypothetical protein
MRAARRDFKDGTWAAATGNGRNDLPGATRDRDMPGGVMSIVTAIQKRNLLSFRYGGRARLVEPHVYGVNSKGHRALSGFQLRGGSTSGEHHGWKMFLVEDIEDLTLLPDRSFKPRPDYNPDDPSFSGIFARV